jgi:hypothetical protein
LKDMLRKQWYIGLLSIMLFCIIVPGCRTLDDSAIVHNELLMYDEPFDKTFLTVIEAVDKTPGWGLAGTEKAMGKVFVQRTDFSITENATILVKIIGPKKTSVELDSTSQRMKGVEALLKQIDLELNKN